jgi:hypothetical protein
MGRRRFGIVETIAGEAGLLGLPAKPANSIERSDRVTQDLCAGRHRGRAKR